MTASSDLTGCYDVSSKEIIISPNPVVDFDVDDVCFGFPAEFVNVSSIPSGSISFTWDFGDGNVSTLSEPSYLYSTDGTFPVILTAISSEGCTGQKNSSINIHSQPIASFDFIDHCFGTPTNFNNLSTINSGVLDYKWEFGDGVISTLENPSHQYNFPGSYSVSLTTSSDNGCVDNQSNVVTSHPVPRADFDLEDVCLGLPSTFQNLSSIISGSITYSWDFGDGNSSTLKNPTHIFTYPDEYDIQLTATSEFSCQDINSKKLKVLESTQSGSISGPNVLCIDDDSRYNLFLNGHVGSILRWEKSSNGLNQWLSIENTSNFLEISELTESTYFRTVVQNGLCDVMTSDPLFVEVNGKSKGGILSGGGNVCYGENSGTLTLTGLSGSVLGWQKSTISDEGPWTAILTTGNEYQYIDLTKTTYFRVEVQNGVCGSVFSEVERVTVDEELLAGILVGGSVNVCENDNYGSLVLSGYNGDIIRWESATNDQGPWSSINLNSPSINYENLGNTTYFRVITENGSCGQTTSNKAVIYVSESTDPGVISGISEVCAGSNEGILTLFDYSGDILRWESTVDKIDWIDAGIDGSSLPFFDLGQTTWYRVAVQNVDCGELFTPVHEVKVHPLALVDFEVDDVCQGESSEFVNNTTLVEGEIQQFLWDFSTGSSSTNISPKYLFPDHGSYPVTLKVITMEGCVDSLQQSINVNPKPSAKFSVEDVCEGDSVNIIDLSSVDLGEIVNYNWSLGDGNQSIQKNIQHLYNGPGDYTIELDIKSDNGCNSTASKILTVEPAPVIQFEAKDVCFGTPMEFQNNSTINEGVLSYEWIFSDGTVSGNDNPQKLFDKPGTHTVELSGISDKSCISTLIKDVQVIEQPIVNFEADNSCVGSIVTFENISIGDSLSYNWSFGDGTFSQTKFVEHIYNAPGVYNVSLSAENVQGCGDVDEILLSIQPLPQLNFVSEEACEGDSVLFQNLSSISSGNVEYLWDFGNGRSSFETSPSHYYDSLGSYVVQLEGRSEFGCISRKSQLIEIFPLPKPDFKIDPVCAGLISFFQNNSMIEIGEIESFLWDLGNNMSSTLRDPSVRYENSGGYNVELTAISDKGCLASIKKEVLVKDTPIADFEIQDVCFGNYVEPINKSISGAGSPTFQWEFTESEVSVLKNPKYKYEKPGVFSVSLVTKSDEGCLDSITRSVMVYELPDVNAGNDTIVSQGFKVQLNATGARSYSWEPIEYLNNSEISNPTATVVQPVTYTVTGKDSFGCVGIDSVYVGMEDDFVLVTNNVFTPDGNGQNDTWVIDNIETFGTANVTVFDRYGKLVFEDREYTNDWNGTAGNDILPDGTYYYVITFSNSHRKYHGAITLIRNR